MICFTVSGRHWSRGRISLRVGIHAVAQWLLERPPLFLLSMMHHDMPGLSDEARHHLIQSSYGVIMRPIVDLVRDAQTRGDVRDIDAHTVAGGFLSLMEGTIIAAQAGLGTELSAMVEAATDMLVHGTIRRGRKRERRRNYDEELGTSSSRPARDPCGCFDLDGTLYPGDVTLEYYLERVLADGGISNRKEMVLRETLRVLDGTHPDLRLGEFVRGLPGESDFDSMQLPPNTPTGDLPGEWTYLGDGWTVVYYLTRAARIEREAYVGAFHASRHAMSAGELDHAPSPRLQAVLMQLKQVGVRLVMQTNSSEDSGWPTLRYLGLDSVFDDYVFTAEKPSGMKAAV